MVKESKELKSQWQMRGLGDQMDGQRSQCGYIIFEVRATNVSAKKAKGKGMIEPCWI